MPIRKEMRALYPPDWPQITERIRERAGNCCERCGVPNGSVGYRDSDGSFWIEDGESYIPDDVGKLIRIICTTAHLNHDPTDNRDENLAFLCQKCHNTHDGPMRAAGRRERAAQIEGQASLF